MEGLRNTTTLRPLLSLLRTRFHIEMPKRPNAKERNAFGLGGRELNSVLGVEEDTAGRVLGVLTMGRRIGVGEAKNRCSSVRSSLWPTAFSRTSSSSRENQKRTCNENVLDCNGPYCRSQK